MEKLSARPVVRQAVAEFDRSFHRASSSFGSDGRDSAVPSSSRSTPSRMLGMSVDDLMEMKDKFRVHKLSEVLKNLRNYLTDEIAQLKDDVNYLRVCL